MSVTKDGDTGRWMSQIRVTDWTGKTIHKSTRRSVALPPRRKPCNGSVTLSANPQAASA